MFSSMVCIWVGWVCWYRHIFATSSNGTGLPLKVTDALTLSSSTLLCPLDCCNALCSNGRRKLVFEMYPINVPTEMEYLCVDMVS